MQRENGNQPAPVCLIEANPLAESYLVETLGKDKFIRLIEFGCLLDGSEKAMPAPVFVLDNCGLPIPLSECLRRLRYRWPESKFIVLDRELDREEVFRLLWFGIDGHMAYRDVAESLLQAVHSVAQNRVWVPREVLRDFLRWSKTGSRTSGGGRDSISMRESQIVELVKHRMSNKEIAETLGIEECTVKFHLSNIYSKLQVTTRHELFEKNVRWSALGRFIMSLSGTIG